MARSKKAGTVKGRGVSGAGFPCSNGMPPLRTGDEAEDEYLRTVAALYLILRTRMEETKADVTAAD